MWNTTDPQRQRSPLHRQWREEVLKRAGGACQIQYPGRCTGTATEADHITELADGGAELDPNNGQAACHNCHAHKTALHANHTRWTKHNTSTKHPNEPHPALR